MHKIFLFLGVCVFLAGCSTLNVGPFQTVVGSGVIASETREVSGFNAIEIVGSADVVVNFGDTESVKIETDNNVLPLIETKVSFGKLVIGTRPNTSTNTRLGIRVTVTAKSLQSAGISGSGNLTIKDVKTENMALDLPGSGTLTVSGKAENVSVNLNGSGNILASNLQAQVVTVALRGSGNVSVFAAQSLDATINGSGSVRYSGSPAKLKTAGPGSGVFIPQP